MQWTLSRARPQAPARRQVPSGRRAPLRRTWWRILLGGIALWLASLLTVLATGNLALIPAVILLGSFTVPVAFVAWAFQRWRDEDLSTELIVTAFVAGGLLGTLGAALVEAYLLRPSPWLFLGVGLIEEAAKLAGLVFVTRRVPRRHIADGIVLGASVGFGFAAFESAGYAFQVLLAHGSLAAMVQTEVLRGALAPFGHGLWTAVLGGVLFWRGSQRAQAPGSRSSRSLRGRRAAPSLLLAYLWVSVLHAAWDSMQGLAVVVVVFLTGSAGQQATIRAGSLPSLSAGQQNLLLEVDVGGLAVVAVLGLVTLAAIRRAARRQARAPSVWGATAFG